MFLWEMETTDASSGWISPSLARDCGSRCSRSSEASRASTFLRPRPALRSDSAEAGAGARFFAAGLRFAFGDLRGILDELFFAIRGRRREQSLGTLAACCEAAARCEEATSGL